jgi:virginiamycin B lyase
VNVPGTLAQISVGFDGDVWGVDSAHQVWHWNSQAQSWTAVPGSLSQIVVAADGAVWGLDPQNNIFVYR